eukprot:g29098.t1
MHRSAQCCEKSLVMSAELAGRLVAHVLGGWRSYCQIQVAHRRRCAKALQARENLRFGEGFSMVFIFAD